MSEPHQLFMARPLQDVAGLGVNVRASYGYQASGVAVSRRLSWAWAEHRRV